MSAVTSAVAAAARFHKVSAAGLVLPVDATEWEGVFVPELKIIVSADPLPCGEVNWSKAQAEAAKFKFCDHQGERPPSRLEYAHLIDDALYGPALDPVYFRTADRYSWEWTSTECAPAGYAWSVDLHSGGSGRGYQGDHGRVRALCASQF